MTAINEAAMDAGTAPRVNIRFESVSGQGLQKRFNTLAKFYERAVRDNPGEWIAAEFKKSLIANIEKGTIVVTLDGQHIGLA